MIIGTAARLQGQSAVGPELAFATEAKGSLHPRQQQGSANRAQEGDTGQQSRGRVFAALNHQIASGLAAQPLQRLQLLEHALGAVTLADVRELRQPRFPPSSRIQLLPLGGNRLAAV